ncbi:MAG: ATP-binding protein [Cyclobacteriaceae bacterium]
MKLKPLHQVFQNLISNSLKYHSPEKPPKIEIGCQEQRKCWCFYVKDNGIGISAAHSERVFVLFSRLHSKTEFSGTGIGLAMCKKIIENLEGEIWFRSSENKGCTFYFTVPKIAPNDPQKICDN